MSEIIGRYNTLSEKHKKFKDDIYRKLITWETSIEDIHEMIPPDKNKDIEIKLNNLKSEILYWKGVVQDL